MPAKEEHRSRIILIGNLLHTDALMNRIKNRDIARVFEFPLIDKDGKVTWEAKYPTQKDLDKKRAEVGYTAWMREFLLKIVPEEGQEVLEEWIQYYDRYPAQESAEGTGMDLAISKSETADYTAMVSGRMAHMEGRPQIFIDPNPVNERLSFFETQEQAKMTARMRGAFHQFFIEDVQYQKAAIEELNRAGINAKGMKAGTDKRARLRAVARYIQDGTVEFPRKGAEDLILQLIHFGIEEHDDLVDAFCYLVLGLIESGFSEPYVVSL